MASTGDLITRNYYGFRGADFRGEEINLSRSPDCLNVWKDYKEIDSIRTRPKMEKVESFEGNIQGIYLFKNKGKDIIIVHGGYTLFKIVDGEASILKTSIADYGESQGFVFDKKFYFCNGSQYWVYDGTNDMELVEGYIPHTTIGRKPAGGGTVHEDVNLLTPRRINSFVADVYTNAEGEEVGSTIYVLDTDKLDISSTVKVTVNGELWGESEKSTGEYIDENASADSNHSFSVHQHTDKHWYVSFVMPPPVPLTDGQDNVEIEFSVKDTEVKSKRITNCTIFQVFDNRVFASGNPDYPGVVWHCSLEDPTYWSDLDYYNEGGDGAKVRGLVAGNNALWVIKEPSSENASIYYHVPTIDSEYGKIYPSAHSSIALGCVGKAINFNDDIVFFSKNGMEGISSDVTTEQAVAHRSTLVDRKLLKEDGYKDMILAEWEGYLIVIVDGENGSRAYLADSRGTFTNNDHFEYEWFYWEFDKKINCAATIDGVLYLGTDDGVYTLTDNVSGVESYWTTPKDKFEAQNKLKTTNKRGCIIEAKAPNGELSVSVKVEDSEYEHIGTYRNILDYIVSRIKRKKWKDIQLKFHSTTRFSLESATLEAFIGGYIKR